MSAADTEKRFAELEGRITKIERTVFDIKESKEQQTSNNYSGLYGGIFMLTENQFFNTPRSVREVNKELEGKGYFYSVKSIEKALRVDFLTKKKLLSRIRVDGIWKYAVRK